ncbi:hypothetical protein [Streptomyces goshikiensis]|uniref:hypothetical protein n=1 Tax=Streptomyces goshikiensis TaxID=1942 RepID=UPI003649288B
MEMNRGGADERRRPGPMRGPPCADSARSHFPDHRLSADGVEMHIALDYLAAYGLTTLLDGPLRRGRARVVNVASDTLNDTRQIKLAGRPRPVTLDLIGVDDLAQLNPRAGFVPFEAYARAKLMTVTAGFALARDLATTWCHPCSGLCAA